MRIQYLKLFSPMKECFFIAISTQNGGKWVFVPNLQTKQQNASILKLFSKMSLFLKLSFNKIKLQVELDISNVNIEFDFEDIKFKKQEHSAK